jgi:hypothetical protein
LVCCAKKNNLATLSILPQFELTSRAEKMQWQLLLFSRDGLQDFFFEVDQSGQIPKSFVTFISITRICFCNSWISLDFIKCNPQTIPAKPTK